MLHPGKEQCDSTYIGVGAGQVGPVLTGPLFRKKLVGVTIITINTCVLVRAAAASSASGSTDA